MICGIMKRNSALGLGRRDGQAGLDLQPQTTIYSMEMRGTITSCASTSEEHSLLVSQQRWTVCVRQRNPKMLTAARYHNNTGLFALRTAMSKCSLHPC